jgi:Zn-dependent protease
LVVNPWPNLGIDFGVIPGYLIGIILGFVLHELAHKAVANRLGAEAFFKLWPYGVVFGLMLALISSWKFLAPGAVVVYGHKFGRWKYRLDRVFTTPHGAALSTGEMGLISVAGPIVNIILAFVFMSSQNIIFQQIAYINAFLAVFNLLPIPPLDGSKVFLWNAVIWLFVLILAAVPLLSLVL